LGIPKIGTVGLLLKAKQAGVLSTITPDLERLRSQGFSTSQSVVDAIVEQAGEGITH
jgi:predicted nucleic acid-binding protein